MHTEPDPSPVSSRTTTDVTHRAPSHRATSGADAQLDSSLEAACAALVRSEWAADSEPDDPELARYRSAIRAFVINCKRAQLPPERVLVDL